MGSIADLVTGFGIAFSLTNLQYCLFGVTLGTLIGVLRGVGSLAAVSMLLPITYYLEQTTALVMLAGVFYGAEYGGSIASILLNLPGRHRPRSPPSTVIRWPRRGVPGWRSS